MAALDFYDDLEVDNTKSFWEAHKQVWKESVQAPMVGLTDELAAEFGAAKVFRPYRDVRFARDKTPYKNHQGAFVAAGPATGWYVEISSPGLMVGVGFYEATSERLARLRSAIADDRTGPELVKIIKALQRKGFELGGEKVKTAPRGYDVDHPRIDLLRHKQIVLRKSYGFDPVIHTADVLSRIRKDWRAGRPLIDWLAAR